MAVLPEFHGRGIAKALYQRCCEELKKQGIWKCNLYVLDSNPAALEFWKHNGWQVLEYDFKMLQKNLI
jgi:ribosomal protein S18 acetylase RimI-like enzyme